MSTPVARERNRVAEKKARAQRREEKQAQFKSDPSKYHPVLAEFACKTCTNYRIVCYAKKSTAYPTGKTGDPCACCGRKTCSFVEGSDRARASTSMVNDPRRESVTNTGDIDDHTAHPDSDSDLSSDQETQFSPSGTSSRTVPTSISIKLKRPSTTGSPIVNAPVLADPAPGANVSTLISNALVKVHAPGSASDGKRPRSEDDQPDPGLSQHEPPTKTARNDSQVRPDEGILARLQEVSDPEFGRHLLEMITRHVIISGNLKESTVANGNLNREVERHKAISQDLRYMNSGLTTRITRTEKQRDVALVEMESAKADAKAAAEQAQTAMEGLRFELNTSKAKNREIEKERDMAVQSTKLAKEDQEKAEKRFEDVKKRSEEVGQEVFLLVKELDLTKAKLAETEKNSSEDHAKEMEELRAQLTDAVRNAASSASARREAETEVEIKKARLDVLSKQLENITSNNEHFVIDLEETRAENLRLLAKLKTYDADKTEVEDLRIAYQQQETTRNRLSQDAELAKQGEVDAKEKLASLQLITNQATVDRISAEGQRDQALANQVVSNAERVEIQRNYNLARAEIHMLRPEIRKLKRDIDVLKGGNDGVKREPRCSMGVEEDKVEIDLTISEDEDEE